jgi:hypothetical protein
MIPQPETGRAEAPLAAIPRGLERIRPRLWLLGWWAASRLIVIATALAIRPSGWILGSWDGRWYRTIARDGYLLVPGRQSDPAFFPFYPVVLRSAHDLGVNYAVAGPLVSNVALLAGLALFEALTRNLFGPQVARRATIYLAVFPVGYVFSMTYPESMVLVLMNGAALAAIRRRWWLAAACGAVAAVTRPEGVFIALPLAAIAWRQRRSLGPIERGAAAGAVVAPAAALASYPLYLSHVIHDPLAWPRAQLAWGRRFHALGPITAIEHLPVTLGHNAWLVRDVIAFVAYLVLLAVAWRVGTPLSWLLTGLAIVVLPVFSGGFDSIARFGLLVPPLFWALAWLGRRRGVDLAIRVASITLLVGATLTIPHVFP